MNRKFSVFLIKENIKCRRRCDLTLMWAGFPVEGGIPPGPHWGWGGDRGCCFAWVVAG